MQNLPFDLQTLVIALTVLATATMAVTGVMQALRHGFDPLGAGVLALITAVGGGTVRDLLLGATPVFWINDLIYVGTVIPVVIISYLFARQLRAGNGRRERVINYIDAIGLALFTILGVQKSLTFDVHPVISILMGCITGIAGGIIRDILCGEKPVVLRQDLYATLSLAGGALLLVLLHFLPASPSFLITFFAILISRVWVIRHGIALPKTEQ
ncbi:unnamed protein product [Cyprideis torosa]|uniref:Glycine transporter domain-containing protein n=1 Tax=Cyprideis torosa TaxID=163714 RepID=A0A7R8ZV21_9CRUS|nr:unnamed protein product [Cyprideis torosa]CAG0910320.1 unnamed protein product [Cyprideis torosa]